MQRNLLPRQRGFRRVAAVFGGGKSKPRAGNWCRLRDLKEGQNRGKKKKKVRPWEGVEVPIL